MYLHFSSAHLKANLPRENTRKPQRTYFIIIIGRVERTHQEKRTQNETTAVHHEEIACDAAPPPSSYNANKIKLLLS